MVDILQISSEPSIQPTPIQEQNACVCVCVFVCVCVCEVMKRRGGLALIQEVPHNSRTDSIFQCLYILPGAQTLS